MLGFAQAIVFVLPSGWSQDIRHLTLCEWLVLLKFCINCVTEDVFRFSRHFDDLGAYLSVVSLCSGDSAVWGLEFGQYQRNYRDDKDVDGAKRQ